MKTITSGLVLSLLLVFTLSNCKNQRAARSSMLSSVSDFSSNTVLIVRLNTAEQKIKTLIEANQPDMAAKVRKDMDAANEETMKAFKDHFHFCNVFFLDPADAKPLKEGNHSQVSLLDRNGNLVQDLSFLKNDYFVASFSYVYQDVFVKPDKGNSLQQVGGTSGLPALVIMDKDYIQLSKPFPYYVRTAFDSKTKAVKKLDNKLKHHYESRKWKIYRNRALSYSN